MRGATSRREALGALAAILALSGARRAGAADYASAQEALAAIEGFERDVDACLRRLQRSIPGARRMCESFARDRERHRTRRARVRSRLGLAPAGAAPDVPEAPQAPLAMVREAQSALVYAHAEALPTLQDGISVGLLMGDMVDLARQLTVIDLWIEAEEARA